VQVGVLGGTGPAGRALAARLASVGVDVVIGSRSIERAEETCETIRSRWPDRDLRLVPGENAAAALNEIVVVATPWDASPSTAASVAEHLEGKVVVSMANAVAKVGDELQFVVPPRGSVAVSVQDAVPGALVSAAFHHLPARVLGDLDATFDCDVLICSDHPTATKVTSELVDMVPGLRPLDAGSLSNAGALESFTAVLLRLNARYRTRATVRITGIDT
jgi:NADPH-dependent F420 reductase